MQAALERGWPLAILVQIWEKTQNEIQHGADQATPERQVRSPDRHTYSEGHVRAQQRAKRV